MSRPMADNSMLLYNLNVKESLAKQISQKVTELVVGPQTEGKIVDIHRDNFKPEIYHILVETLEGKRKEFIEFEQSLVYSPQQGFIVSNLFDRIQLGGWYSIRTHGKGFVPLLSGKIENDPFNLKSEL